MVEVLKRKRPPIGERKRGLLSFLIFCKFHYRFHESSNSYCHSNR